MATSSTVLLVHGLASSATNSWVRFGWITELEKSGWEVIAPDLTGHGDAPKPKDPEAYANLEEDTFSLVENCPKVAGVGFSLGARIVLGIEVNHPGTFERIVVGGVGANLLVSPPTGALADALESGGFEVEGDPLAFAMLKTMRSANNDPLALAAFLRRPGQRRFQLSDFATIRCPVLVVVGDEDRGALPPEPLLEALENATLLVLPGADHFGTMRSHTFLHSALDFLDSDQGRQGQNVDMSPPQEQRTV